MKKTVAFLVLSVLSFSLAGCAETDDSSKTSLVSNSSNSAIEETVIEEKTDFNNETLTTTEQTTEKETESTTVQPTIETTAEATTAEESTISESIYDIAFKLKNNEYSVYYLIDTDSAIARSFTTNDTSVSYGTCTGSLDSILDIYYPGEGLDFHEYIKEKENGNDSLVLVTNENDPNFEYAAELRKCDVEEAELILNQSEYHDINH